MHALISVYDKTGITDFSRKLVESGYTIISTGGTEKTLSEAGVAVTSLSTFTGFPEILGGRVKSLHPTIFGGILANPANPDHIRDAEKHNLPDIGVVVVNLYPFWTISKNDPDEKAVEEIDIGGVALIRAAAKNFANVSVLTSSEQYDDFLERPEVDIAYRRELAAKAFRLTCDYDNSIANHFSSETTVQRTYHSLQPSLKYGCNPHQAPALIYSIDANKPPLKLLNGSWSYINVLDAVNAWGLVSELDISLDLQGSVASFKHTSPAGAASPIAWNQLSIHTKQMLTVVYGLSERTPIEVLTYARARNSDPQSSFGDFIGFNGIVSDELAEFIAHQVSDGIIASGFTDKALETLKAKKKGAYVIIQRLQTNGKAPELEFREIGGVALSQPKNTKIITAQDILASVPTKNSTIPDNAVRDLIVANVCMKFAQSNNVACAYEGQLIGLAAGQQSRIDAVKLMTRKVKCWLNRHNAAALSWFAAASGTRQERIINYTVAAEKTAITEWLPDISVASDAFFPFSDNIDELSRIPVKFITQAGGSIRDTDVIEACDRLGIAMSMTGIRVFTH